jgi:hypothetical protein
MKQNTATKQNGSGGDDDDDDDDDDNNNNNNNKRYKEAGLYAIGILLDDKASKCAPNSALTDSFLQKSMLQCLTADY